MATFKPSLVTIQDCEYQDASGSMRGGSIAHAVAFVGEWRGERVLHGPDHWDRATERAADSFADAHGIEVIDLRD